MGVFEFKVGRKKPTPGEVAKERLKVVLVHDRLKLNPELLEMIKEEILAVLARRFDVDEEQMQVKLAREEGEEMFLANVPVKRQKVAFEWDPPTHTPSPDALRGRMRIEDE
ncbi:MAG TPA: cell division topological specificity factor MinE [Ktedonobacteraceae bacterium]